MVLSLMTGAIPQASAAVTYSVADAIDYAAAHWNDGVGACATFVSKCVRAGGIDIDVLSTTTACANGITKATGVGRTELSLNSSGHATKALNAGILAEGDVVIQYCKTHGTAPHIIFCAGYDSSGVAVYYAHNSALNKGRYKLSQSTAYEHTTSCNMVGQVLHISDLDTSLMSEEELAYMEKCTEYDAYLTLKTNIDKVYLKTLPCSRSTSSASDDVAVLDLGTALTATAIYKNSAGNYWYKVRTSAGDRGFVYSEQATVTGIPSGGGNVNVALGNTTPNKGKSVAIKGSITSAYMTVKSATGTLKDALGATQTKTITSGFGDISGTAINSSLKFGSLSRGPGTLTVKATFQSYYCTDGKTLKTKTCDITQTLKFTVLETYSVVFNANGGENAPAAQSKVCGTNLTLTTDIPTRENYKFLGWATSSSATAAEFQPGGTLNKDVYSGNMTLYAVWQYAPHTHNHTATVTAPTCTEKGYTTYTCDCGDTYISDEVAELGHKIADGVCTRCGEVFLQIVTQPESVAVASGEKAVVTFEATGNGLTYQWYYKDAGASSFKLTTSYTGNTYSVAMTDDRNGRQLYCVVTDQDGNQVRTNTITISMLKNTVKIVTQPVSVTVAEGEIAKVTVKATGDGLTYRWYYKNAGDSSYTYTSTFTGSSYSVTMTEARAGRKVLCRVYDKYGNVAQTNTVSLNMVNTVKITQQPVSVTVAEGEIAKVTVKATGDGLTYRWYYKNAGDSSYTYTSSFTGNTYSVTMTEARAGRKVLCRVYDKYGNVAQTNAVTLNMK